MGALTPKVKSWNPGLWYPHIRTGDLILIFLPWIPLLISLLHRSCRGGQRMRVSIRAYLVSVFFVEFCPAESGFRVLTAKNHEPKKLVKPQTPTPGSTLLRRTVLTHPQSTLLANGSLFVHGSTDSPITLNPGPPTKSLEEYPVKEMLSSPGYARNAARFMKKTGNSSKPWERRQMISTPQTHFEVVIWCK